MAGTVLEFDIYPPDDPAGKISGTGIAAKLVTLALDDQLVDGGFVAELFGMGSGFLEVHIDDAAAELLAPRSYVKVRTVGSGGWVNEDLGGFWLERSEFRVLSKRGQVERVVHWEGEGTALALDRYVLGHSVYASGQTKRGSVNVPGKWTWTNEPYGAILVRVLEEGTDHPVEFYEFLDWDFDRDDDTNGNPWDDLADYETAIGTSGLKLWSDFLRLGLVAEIDADLRVHAYRELSEYRTDRHSATFSAGKVRFEAGINILSDMVKRINPSSQSTHVLIEDRTGDYQTFDEDLDGNPIDGVPYMSFLKSSTTADDTAIAKMGAMHLTYRDQFTDICKVRHLLGPGGANGEDGYGPSPTGDYWLGDLVTVHTGTTEHDYNEQTIEVAALRYLVQGTEWVVDAELGAQYRNQQQATLQAQIAQTVINQIREPDVRTLLVTLGDRSAVIPTGVKGSIPIQFPFTILGWTALADVSGSVQVDVYRDTRANHPANNSDSITAIDPIVISSADEAEDLAPTGWSTECATGDTLTFEVDSCTTIKQVTIGIKVRVK